MSFKLRSENFRSVAGTSLTGTLANVGSITASPGRVVYIFNGCDQEIVVSWDGGVTEAFLLPPLASVSIDSPTNKNEDRTTPFLPAKSQFQVRHNGTIPTSGNVSISVVT